MERIVLSSKELCPASDYKRLYVTKDNSLLVKIIDVGHYDEIIATLTYLDDITSYLPKMAYYTHMGILTDGKAPFIGRPLIKGETLENILYNENEVLKRKIDLLKKLGTILDGINRYFKETRLAFGDVHPGNFMVLDNDELLPIDIESINTPLVTTNSSPFIYFANKNLSDLDKYECNVMGKIMPSRETDIFSLIMISLRVISKSTSLWRAGTYEFFDYLDYLDSLGFNCYLLECFESIYLKTPSIDPTPYFETIPNDLTKASYKAYTKAKKCPF